MTSLRPWGYMHVWTGAWDRKTPDSIRIQGPICVIGRQLCFTSNRFPDSISVKTFVVIMMLPSTVTTDSTNSRMNSLAQNEPPIALLDSIPFRKYVKISRALFADCDELAMAFKYMSIRCMTLTSSAASTGTCMAFMDSSKTKIAPA